MLVDIVSKNGNLLLNVPLRGDGTLDDDEVKCLEGIAQWTAINGEAIFGTRPWKTYGEGTREAKAGNFNEGKGRPYTATDLRFTTKGDTLYVFALAWPSDGKLIVKSLGANQPGIHGDVTGVELLGAGKVEFNREPTGLVVTLPEKQPCETAWALKITGLDLAASQPGDFVVVVPYYVRPDKNGNLQLLPEDATIHGKRAKTQGHGGKGMIVNWDAASDWVSWDIEVPAAGRYDVSARYSAAKGDSEFEFEVAGQKLVGHAVKTSGWDDVQNVKLGRIEFETAGKYTASVRRPAGSKSKAVNLGPVQLRKKG